MNTKAHIYVTRNLRGQWVVRLSGTYRTQKDAADIGRWVARMLDAQFEIRNRLGRIREADSSGQANDPRDIPG